MGCHPELLKLLKQWMPKAFLKGSASLKDPKKGGRQGVVVWDLTCNLHPLKSGWWDPVMRERKPDFTGAELADVLFLPALEMLRTTSVRVLVLGFDQPKFVPREKAETQNKRGKYAKAAADKVGGAYHDDIKLCDGGIILPGEKEPQRFRMERLLANSKHRKELIVNYLEGKFRQLVQKVPQGATLWFDYPLAGPVCLSNGALTQHPEHFHELGEADLYSPYWFQVYNTDAALSVTIDTDQIPILSYYVIHAKRNAPVYWRQNPDTLVDMQVFVEECRTYFHWNVMDMCLAFVLGGTDYVDKSLTYGVGMPDIMWGVQETRELRENEPFESKGPVALEMIVCFIYSKLQESKGFAGGIMSRKLLEKLYAKEKKRLFPSAEDVKKGYKQVMFNLQHWLRDWNCVPTSDSDTESVVSKSSKATNMDIDV